MQKYITAIEVSGQWLKLVAARPSPGGLKIITVLAQPTASLSIEGFSGEVTALIKKLKFTPYPLIVSFPRNLATLRNLHLPSRDPKEIKSIIELHIGRQVPYPREEIVGDYQILGVDEAGYTKVMLAIAHRDNLQRIFNALDIAGLFTEKVNLSSQGVFSWFLSVRKGQLSAGKIYILIDIDSVFTDFMVVDKENLIFSRSIAYGAEQISNQEIKQTKFISELKQSYIIFQTEEMNKKPDKIFISGVTGNSADLSVVLEKELGAAVEVIKTDIDAPGDMSFSALLGLVSDIGRERLALVLPEIQIRKTLKERSRELILLGSLLMFSFIAISGIFLERAYNRTNYLNLLDNRYQEIKKDIEDLEVMVKKTKIIRACLDKRALSLIYIYQINRLVTKEIAVKTIIFEPDGKVFLRGHAQAMSDVFKFITTLEKSGYFKDIQTKYTSQKKIAEGEISAFEIICPMAKGLKK